MGNIPRWFKSYRNFYKRSQWKQYNLLFLLFTSNQITCCFVVALNLPLPFSAEYNVSFRTIFRIPTKKQTFFPTIECLISFFFCFRLCFNKNFIVWSNRIESYWKNKTRTKHTHTPYQFWNGRMVFNVSWPDYCIIFALNS